MKQTRWTSGGFASVNNRTKSDTQNRSIESLIYKIKVKQLIIIIIIMIISVFIFCVIGNVIIVLRCLGFW